MNSLAMLNCINMHSLLNLRDRRVLHEVLNLISELYVLNSLSLLAYVELLNLQHVVHLLN